MKRWFRYLASDFDLRAHRADVTLDLQHIGLPDASIDILLTPHVLEHVPDTHAALSEIHRILAPHGRMYLQVPLLQGHTAPPASPEFHGDNTPVFWRFGFDLTEHLRRAGFTPALLCTSRFHRHVLSRSPQWPEKVSPEFDVESMLRSADPDDLEPLADDATARCLGFRPAYMFFTWECVKDSKASRE